MLTRYSRVNHIIDIIKNVIFIDLIRAYSVMFDYNRKYPTDLLKYFI